MVRQLRQAREQKDGIAKEVVILQAKLDAKKERLATAELVVVAEDTEWTKPGLLSQSRS